MTTVQKGSATSRRVGRRRIARVVIVTMTTMCAAAGVADAQQRPLVTEDPETVGAGRILLEAGLTAEHDAVYPLSGLVGNRWSVPTIGVSIGISSIAEIQIDGSPYQRLSISQRRGGPLDELLDFEGDTTSDVEDIVLATKIRLVSESAGRPALGVRFATQLPDASNESGLGHDLTSFFASLLVAKTVQSVRVVGNAGIAILGDPTTAYPEQNDLLTYGLSVARALTTEGEIVAEVNGRWNTSNGDSDPGSESRAALRFGGRYTRGPVRADAGVMLGLTSRDPDIGITAGVTWVFNAFRIP